MIGAVIGIPTILVIGKLLDVQAPLLASTNEVSAQELPSIFSGFFNQRPASLKIERCLHRTTPLGKDFDNVLGCRVSLAAQDFDAWAASISDFNSYAVTGVPAAFGLFEVGAPIAVTTYFGDHPPDDGRFYGSVLFANADRTEALIYIRLLLVID